MPKNEMNYNNTIIYKIVCNDINVKDLYVGHTTNFKQRKNSHRSECNMNLRKKYEIMNKYGGWNNWSMVVIENYPCKNRLEAEAKERYWIETLKANLNSIIPGNKENITDDTYLLNQSNNFKLIMGDSYEESDKKTCSVIKKQELNDKINFPSPKDKEIEMLREQLTILKNHNDLLVGMIKSKDELISQLLKQQSPIIDASHNTVNHNSFNLNF
jgi:predicted GIY-YIG superfamily endonuclease